MGEETLQRRMRETCKENIPGVRENKRWVVGKGIQVVVPRAHIAIDYTLHRFIHTENINVFFTVLNKVPTKGTKSSHSLCWLQAMCMRVRGLGLILWGACMKRQ